MAVRDTGSGVDVDTQRLLRHEAFRPEGVQATRNAQAAAQALVAGGCGAIATSCGFLALWQRELQAALPVLNLGLDWYRGWHSVVLYPDEFRSRFEEVDEAGVVHEVEDWRSGESWTAGPLILSLDDLRWSGRGEGYDVVIHEFAHKLDMLNGDVDGMPALQDLHAAMHLGVDEGLGL